MNRVTTWTKKTREFGRIRKSASVISDPALKEVIPISASAPGD